LKQDKKPEEYVYSQVLLFSLWTTKYELETEDSETWQSISEEDLHAKPEAELKVIYDEEDILSQKRRILCVKEKLFPYLESVEEGRAIVEQLELLNEIKDIGDILDPAGEQIDDDDEATGCEEVSSLHPGDLEKSSETTRNPDHIFKVPDLAKNEDMFLDSARHLDTDQRAAFNKVIGYCKQLRKASAANMAKPKPPLLVIHGGAGTGKSKLIDDMTYWIEKILRKPSDNLHHPYVIKIAPTGMAAANIGGVTIHAAFRFEFGTSQYCSLGDEKRDKLRDITENLTLMILDEFFDGEC
jgi:hypothetical protein